MLRLEHQRGASRAKRTAISYSLLAVLCSLLYPVSAQAATITAAACSDTGVQDAMNSAASGDTVLVSGTCSLSAITILASKPITLCATAVAGSCVPAAVGTQANPAGSSGVSLAGFTLQCGAGQSRIAGFHVTGGGENDINTCSTTSPMNRIDHNSFTAGGNSLGTHHNSPILVDHNSFQAQLSNDEIIHNFGDQAPDSPPANYSAVWGNSIVPGGPNYPYFEYNTFIDNLGGGNAVSFIQNWTGAEVIFRDNQMYGSGIIDAHGNRYYKTRWFEVYNNTFTNEASGQSQIRGGSGFIFNNSCSGSSCGWGFFEDPNTWLSYPSCNQVGRGITTGPGCGNSSNSGAPSTEFPSPVYIWGDNPTQTPACFEGTWHSCNTTDQMIQLNRDIFVSTAKPASMVFCEDSSATGNVSRCTHTISTYTPFTDPFPLTSNGLPNPSGGSTLPVCLNACDVNCDNADNVADVQQEINMALGKATCTNQFGSCNVTSVQKVINAALGGACVAP